MAKKQNLWAKNYADWTEKDWGKVEYKTNDFKTNLSN